MAFQNRLKERREFLKMSRADLAEKLNITISAIGNYENGISSPKTEILFDIFKTLDCDANYLFQDDINTNIKSISDEGTEVAQSYDKAEFKAQNTVRMILDLPLKSDNKVIEKKQKKDEIVTLAAHLEEELTEEQKKFIDNF